MKVLKIVLIVLAAIILFVGVFLGVLTITEFMPKDVQQADVLNNISFDTVELGREYTALSFNTGYAGLGKESDFFMDGGKSVRTTRELTEKNLEGIKNFLSSESPDFVLLQEVDRDSKRTYGIDETQQITDLLGKSSSFALNYSCPYVPFPLPTIGKVNSGIMTLSNAAFTEAKRISLPIPFKWPIRIANLKRCLLTERFPVEGTDRELVIINLHLEAYDDGEGKIAQTKQLVSLLLEEYNKGNYVIAGGDFNQSFPGALDFYPTMDENYWTPGKLELDLLPQDWQMCCDMATPSCRLLNVPYDASGDKIQYYVIDGFICSPNVTVEKVETKDLGFEFSDHNPVKMSFALKD